MIQLHATALTEPTIRQLAKLQGLVDAEGTYAERVAHAKKEWDDKTSSKEKKKVFTEVGFTFARLFELCPELLDGADVSATRR